MTTRSRRPAKPKALRHCSKQGLRRKLAGFLRRYADDLPPEAIKKATRNLEHWTAWCDRQGEVTAAMRYDPNDWYLCTVKNAAVSPKHRGKGYGSRLYRATAERALKTRTPEGYPRCLVLAADVTVDNIPSIRALERAGFNTVNRFCWAKGEKPADIMHFVRMPPRRGGKC